MGSRRVQNPESRVQNPELRKPSGRLCKVERETMEKALRLALNDFQRKNYGNIFRRAWRWAYRTGLTGGRVEQNYGAAIAKAAGYREGLRYRNRTDRTDKTYSTGVRTGA